MTALNPGIRRVVELLNNQGFPTTDSGDGQTHDFTCDRAYGYVVVVPDGDPVQETDRLCALLRSLGVALAPLTVDGPVNGVYVQLSYSPIDGGIAVIDVSGIHDSMLYP